jgi:broad specificity phosphatase PhoE
VQRIAARLSRWDCARGASVYTSTLPRARESGEIIATAIGGSSPAEDCRLCSYHVLDEYDGRPHADEHSAARRGGGLNLFRPEHEGGDHWGLLMMRAAEAYHEIADRHYGETVVIATHNETIQASLIALGYLPFRNRLGVSVAPASITEWVTEGDTTAGGPHDDWAFVDWNLVRLNDTGHTDGWPEMTRHSAAQPVR